MYVLITSHMFYWLSFVLIISNLFVNNFVCYIFLYPYGLLCEIEYTLFIIHHLNLGPQLIILV